MPGFTHAGSWIQCEGTKREITNELAWVAVTISILFVTARPGAGREH